MTRVEVSYRPLYSSGGWLKPHIKWMPVSYESKASCWFNSTFTYMGLVHWRVHPTSHSQHALWHVNGLKYTTAIFSVTTAVLSLRVQFPSWSFGKCWETNVSVLILFHFFLLWLIWTFCKFCRVVVKCLSALNLVYRDLEFILHTTGMLQPL